MYKVITFDMFSAVLNIEGTAKPIVSKIIPCLPEEKALEFFRMWRIKQWDYVLLSGHMEQGYKSYEYLTRCALNYAIKKFDLSLKDEQIKSLINIWFSFNPWDEAKEVISKLKEKGYIVAMLSNGDTKMLQSIASHCKIEFDYIFSAEMVQAYKPCKAIYKQVFDTLKIKDDECLHVAGSMFDTLGAVSCGYHCCWSNRYNDQMLDENYKPQYQISNLTELLNIL